MLFLPFACAPQLGSAGASVKNPKSKMICGVFVSSIDKLVGASFMQALLSGQESELNSHGESCGPGRKQPERRCG